MSGNGAVRCARELWLSSPVIAPPPVPSKIPVPQRRIGLRGVLHSGEPLILPGATDAAGAMLIQAAGFSAVYATGAGIANAQLGLPDIGLASQAEFLEQTRRMAAACDLPVVADVDTGFGGVPSVIRTVQLFEAAGASGLQLEDQVMPKRCGHFEGHALVDMDEMVGKIRAAVAARSDEATLLIARTDARGVYGLEEAIRRGQAYLDAGADALFVEAPRSYEELTRIGSTFGGALLVANMVEGGKTPMPPVAELASLGFRIILFANFLMRTMLFAGQQALAHLAMELETASYQDRMLSWADRQSLFGLAEFEAAENHFLGTAGT